MYILSDALQKGEEEILKIAVPGNRVRTARDPQVRPLIEEVLREKARMAGAEERGRRATEILDNMASKVNGFFSHVVKNEGNAYVFGKALIHQRREGMKGRKKI